MREPRVSVVIPAFNAGDTLVEALASLQRQSLSEWEAVVVDDGSDDDTLARAKTIDDPRIRLLQQGHRGVSAARNRAIENSSGPLVAFLDADDVFMPSKLEQQVAFLARRPEVGATYCAHRRVDSEGVPWTIHVPPPEVDGRLLLTGFPFNPSAVVVRRRYLERVGGFRPDLGVHEDRELWLRLDAAGCRFARTEGVLLDYRMGPQRREADPKACLEQVLEIIDGAEDLLRSSPGVAQWADKARMEAYREWTFRAAIRDSEAFAVDCFEKLLAADPGLGEEGDRRDELLQAAVDFAVRSRSEPRSTIERLFVTFGRSTVDLGSSRDWAMGSCCILRAVREAMWNRSGPMQVAFDEAESLGARLDDRTERLVAHQWRRFEQAYGADSMRDLVASVREELLRVSDPRRVDALCDRFHSLPAGLRPGLRWRRWLARLRGGQ